MSDEMFTKLCRHGQLYLNLFIPNLCNMCFDENANAKALLPPPYIPPKTWADCVVDGVCPQAFQLRYQEFPWGEPAAKFTASKEIYDKAWYRRHVIEAVFNYITQDVRKSFHRSLHDLRMRSYYENVLYSFKDSDRSLQEIARKNIGWYDVFPENSIFIYTTQDISDSRIDIHATLFGYELRQSDYYERND